MSTRVRPADVSVREATESDLTAVRSLLESAQLPLDGLEALELYEENFTVAVPNNHALAKKPAIKLDDLNGETLQHRRL